MLDPVALSHKLHQALSQKTDGFGLPTPVSEQSLNYAKGIIAALKAASVSNAPGTITGITSPGGPLSNGTGIGGIIAIQPAPMISITGLGLSPLALPMLQKENAAIVAYIGTGLVTFAPGNITGTCSSTGVSPGPLVSGAGTGGVITGLTGVAATAAVAAAIGTIGPDMLKHYTALIDYLIANASVSYAPGSVVGVCPAGGGALAGGAATGGVIT